MDKSQALYSFWSGFGLVAYDENTVPDDAVMPYITYSSSTDSLDGTLSLYGSLWYKSFSWKEISKKTEEIAKFIYEMTPIRIEGGYLWINKGTPFAQRMSDPSDDLIRRMYININAEFLTAY